MNKIIALALMLLAGAASAQAPRRGAFVIRLGTDTVAVERYERTTDLLEGDIVSQYPRAVRVHYAIRFDASQHARELELIARASGTPDAPPLLERRVRIDGDVVTSDIVRNGVRDTVNSGTLRAGRGAVPFVQNSNAVIEEVVRRFLEAKRDTLLLQRFVFGPQGAFTDTIARMAGDTIVVQSGQPLLVRADRQGNLLVADAKRTTVRTIAERATSVDVDAIERRFLERGVVGVVSPRDTVEVERSGVRIWVDYGRPSARGRAVFGVLVPWGQVWRAGANAATQFRTNVDLNLGGTLVPAGTYTLWIIPDRASAKLIINKQTGQWGTAYDATQDLTRIDLSVERLARPVDQFTIDVGPAPAGGVLRFAWENQRFSVNFRPATG
jgi:hypothetical protein